MHTDRTRVTRRGYKTRLHLHKSLVGLLQVYSNRYAHQIRTVIQLVESAPKRSATSTNVTVRHRQLDRRLSPDIITELVATYRAGTSTNELCRRYNISKGSVLKLLANHGVTMRQQPMTEQEINEAVHLYVDDEVSIRAIATTLGKSKGSVWKALHERGVTMRPAH